MTGLVAKLKQQNAKERYWLLSAALGQPKLGEEYREALKRATGWVVPPNAWWAMDYHLDWLACAATGSWEPGKVQELRVPGWKLGSQEDVDLIVAWDEGKTTKLVLVEAKGVTSNSNSQVRSKFTKLTALFGQDGQNVRGVDPRFVLASPQEPSKLVADAPEWAKTGSKLSWMPLFVPNDLVAPTRCLEDGISLKSGNFWKWKYRFGGSQ